jgi:uncharacterized membrane protein
MGLLVMIVGLVLFLGPHVFVSMRAQRESVIAAVGEWPYKGIFAVITLIGLIVTGYGFAAYRGDGIIPVWSPPAFMRHITEALMWPAAVFVVAAYIRGDIARKLKHPMLVGVKTWALAHLLANGDLGGIILFGSILAWAVYDRITLKRRRDPGGPPIPYGGRRNDVIAVIVGTLLYVALGLWFHPAVIGMKVFGS